MGLTFQVALLVIGQAAQAASGAARVQAAPASGVAAPQPGRSAVQGDPGADAVSVRQALARKIVDADLPAFTQALRRSTQPDAEVFMPAADAGRRWTNLDGFPLVVVAAGVDDVRFLEVVLAHHGNPNAKARGLGWTPLHYAISRALLENVRVLLAAGADPNVVDSKGWTPLDHAAATGLFEIARLLISSGAEPRRGFREGDFFKFSVTHEVERTAGAQAELERLRDVLRAKGF